MWWSPGTFTSFDLGAFENQFPSITVEANRAGIAATKFTGTPGTVNNVDILASSPMTSGRLRFIVRVILPPEDLNDEGQEKETGGRRQDRVTTKGAKHTKGRSTLGMARSVD